MDNIIGVPEVMPHSDDAEKAVLGALILNSDLTYEIAQIIEADDFYLEKHKIIFRTIQKLNDGDRAIDVVTLTEALRIDGMLESVGGAIYLTELCDAVSSLANAPAYAGTVRDKAIKRRLIYINNRITDEACKGEKRVEELLDDAEGAIYGLNQLAEPTSLRQVGVYVTEAYDNIGCEEKGIPTFIEVDKLIGGLKKGEMTIVAARPGMGKTTICLNIAERAATEYGKTVAFFTLEMTPVQT